MLDDEKDWEVIFQNMSFIKNTCYKHFKNSNLDLDDVVQQVLVDLKQNFHKYEEERGSITTFIWWQIRLTKRNIFAYHKKHNYFPLEETGKNDYLREIELVDLRIDLNKKLKKLKKKDCITIKSFLENWSDEKIKRILKINKASRDMRIYRLRKQINQT